MLGGCDKQGWYVGCGPYYLLLTFEPAPLRTQETKDRYTHKQ